MSDFTVQAEERWVKVDKVTRPGVYVIRGHVLGNPDEYEIAEVRIASVFADYTTGKRRFEKGDLITNFGSDRSFSNGDEREWRRVNELKYEMFRFKFIAPNPVI